MRFNLIVDLPMDSITELYCVSWVIKHPLAELRRLVEACAE